jgi:peptidoglycan hydrolase-like protein with peptidoglycan-binding domain
MNKHIKRILVLCTLLPSFVFAQTSMVTNDSDGSPIDCAVITHNLKLGSRDAATGGDVTTLQIYLSQANYLDSDPTGYFGRATRKAVQDFQTANNIAPAGNVGPMTRAKIKEISCPSGVGAATDSTSANSVYTKVKTNDNQGVQSSTFAKIDLKANGSDNAISLNGAQQVKLSWETTGVTSCQIEVAGVASTVVPLTGFQETNINPDWTSHIALSCKRSNNNEMIYDYIKVVKSSQSTQTSTTEVKANPSISYFYNTNTSVKSGEGVTLKWVAANAVNCSVMHLDENSTVADGISIGTATEYTFYPTKSTTYTLSCFGSSVNGKDVPAAEKKVYVNVTASLPLPTCEVSQQTTSISNSVPFVISWSSKNATYGKGPFGDKIDTTGKATYQLMPGEEKKYEFTFFNADGKSTTCSAFFSTLKG